MRRFLFPLYPTSFPIMHVATKHQTQHCSIPPTGHVAPRRDARQGVRGVVLGVFGTRQACVEDTNDIASIPSPLRLARVVFGCCGCLKRTQQSARPSIAYDLPVIYCPRGGLGVNQKISVESLRRHAPGRCPARSTSLSYITGWFESSSDLRGKRACSIKSVSDSYPIPVWKCGTWRAQTGMRGVLTWVGLAKFLPAHRHLTIDETITSASNTSHVPRQSRGRSPAPGRFGLFN
jgi:hypothetical protein